MMKYRNVLYTTLISALCLGTTSCSDFLDEMPDNRTELTTEESITKVLVSAYPMTTNFHIGEFYSDNIDVGNKRLKKIRTLLMLYGMTVITRLHQPTKPWRLLSRWEILNHYQPKKAKL